MIIIYGTPVCPDCIEIQKLYAERNIPYEFRDFGSSTQNLKDFLKLRDSLPIFDEVKKQHQIGIPCIILEDGAITLHMEDAWK